MRHSGNSCRGCDDRFGDQWHLSPAQSLLLHAENTIIPTQVVVYSPAGDNMVKLLFGTSLYDLKQAEMPPAAELAMRDGLRLFSVAAALVKVPEAFWLDNPIETQVVFAPTSMRRTCCIVLLDGGHSKKAGQLAAAFRRIGRPEIAGEIIKTMKGAGYDVRESGPFAQADVRRFASRESARRWTPASPMAIKSRNRYQNISESDRTAEDQSCVSPLCSTNLPARRLSLAVDRRLLGHSRPD